MKIRLFYAFLSIFIWPAHYRKNTIFTLETFVKSSGAATINIYSIYGM